MQTLLFKWKLSLTLNADQMNLKFKIMSSEPLDSNDLILYIVVRYPRQHRQYSWLPFARSFRLLDYFNDGFARIILNKK